MEASGARQLPAAFHGIGKPETASSGPRPGADRAVCPNQQAHHSGRVAQKSLASTLPRGEGTRLVDSAPEALPLTTQTDLLNLNRTSLYYRPIGPDPVEVALKHRIDAIYTDRPFYGSRRMTAPLLREGYAVHRKRIPHHMRAMGIWGLAPGPQTSTPIRSTKSIRIY